MEIALNMSSIGNENNLPDHFSVYFALEGDGGDLDIDRRSRLHINYLRATSFKEYSLRVVESSIVDPNFMVLVATGSECELAI